MEEKTNKISSYAIVDMNHNIVYSTIDSTKAEEYFLQLRDSSPNVHIVLAEVKKEFKRENGTESLIKYK